MADTMTRRRDDIQNGRGIAQPPPVDRREAEISRQSPRASGGPAGKVAVDVVVASLLLLAFAPIIVILAAVVRLTSRGPALYSQRRLGLSGRPYQIYKLRTMYLDCERLSGPQWSAPDDPRVTPLGRFLRRCHLDELPQLWNVVRGEMSLVGPRPERPEFVEQLELVIPGYRERLRLRPGITGLAQVQLPPDEDLASVRRKLECDLRYARAMCLWLDFKILGATGLKILGAHFTLVRRG
jgi:lipopolysaccharide/colanic/teichoic acid biosynthesis glycosyltransferase